MPNNSNNKRNSKRPQRGPRSSLRSLKAQPMYPPRITQTRKLVQTIRYVTSGGSALKSVITRRCLLNMKLVLNSTGSATSLGSMFTSVQIKRVQMWAVTAAIQNTISLCWLGPNSPQAIVADIGNVNRPAKIQAYPDKQSLASWWISTGDTDLDTAILQFNTSDSVTIDIKIKYVTQDWTAFPYNGVKPATPPAGLYIYTPPLDNVTITNTTGPGLIPPLYMDGQAGDA